MSTPENLELQQLRERQTHLERQVRQLGERIQGYEQRLAVSPVSDPVEPQSPATGVSPGQDQLGGLARALHLARQAHLPSAAQVPPVISQAQPATERVVIETPLLQTDNPAARPGTPALDPPLPPIVEGVSGNGSFEMRLGTYWLVRIGIVMVLTALVFFGNLAYQNFISKLGPGGKVSLLYLAGFSLLGLGSWLHRRAEKPAMRNYAQVLFAGGLAAVYFTTYAAHHFPTLHVITSPVVDGLLLLGWAATIGWIADRRKSELLGLFSLGLAFYSSTITRAGYFTLYSNLVLTLAAVFFLVRNRWSVLTIAGLFGSYGSYAFWRFFDGSNWHWATPQAGLWAGAIFLGAYWLVFTAAGFLAREPRLEGENRAFFLTANNGAFFALFLLTMLQVKETGLWRFLLTYGVVLLGCAVAAGRLLAREPLTRNAYLTQGLLLVTAGLIVKFSGLQLALMLAVESVMLLASGQLRGNLVLKSGAYAAAAMAAAWGIDGLQEPGRAQLMTGAGLGVLLLFNAFLANRETARPSGSRLSAQPGYFSALALLVWFITTWRNAAPGNFQVALAVEGALLIGSFYLLRIRELSVFAQSYVALAHASLLLQLADSGSESVPWWSFAAVGAAGLALGQWRHRQTIIRKHEFEPLVLALYALLTTALTAAWIYPRTQPDNWIAISAILALAFTAYGLLTRAWFVAGFAQGFFFMGGLQAAMRMLEAKPAWHLPLTFITLLVLVSCGTAQWFRARGDMPGVESAISKLRWLYDSAAVALGVAWVCEYAPALQRVWMLGAVGGLLFAWAGWQRSRRLLLYSSAFWAMAILLFSVPELGTPTVLGMNLLTLVVFLALQRVTRALPDHYAVPVNVHHAWIALGSLCLWLFLSRWVMQQASGFYLTAIWSGLALLLFAMGIALHERVYRWTGLCVLACALGRVVLFDVWKLETIFRILSFLALGIALLVLGFIYNKFQEKLREWL